MKRKLFSALLFGACLMASTSTFVSCKDYDDDIQNLQTQIDANSKAIAEIQKLIQSGSVITNVSSTANGVTVTLSNGNTFNVTNGKDGNDGKDGSVVTIGDNGNWFIDGKDTGLAAQGPKGDQGVPGEPGAAGDDAAVKGEWYALSADCTKLEYYKDGVKDDSKSIEIAKLMENAKVVNAVKTDDVLAFYNLGDTENPIAVISLRTQITALDLWTTYNDITGDDHTDKGNKCPNKVKFTYAEQKANTFPAKAEMADGSLTFKDKFFATAVDKSLVVRVTPANATLKASEITLIDSKGADLSAFVECVGVEPYDPGLYTRSAESKNGLYQLTLKLKDGYDAEAFAKATKATKGEYDAKGEDDVIFAVAVNEESAGKNRLVASEWDVTVGTEAAKPVIDFTVNGEDINTLHNRYEKCEGQQTATTEGVKELVWLDNTKPAVAPIVGSKDKDNPDNAADRKNAENKEYDNRQNGKILPVTVGQDIVIDFSKYKNAKEQEIGGNIAGFYVALDYAFALESAPSELAAWTKYSYEGVTIIGDSGVEKAGTLFKGNKGTIKITSLTGSNPYDIIGFRVIAVNEDGTLCDPDGRAFYVGVGEEKTANTITGTILADKAKAESDFIDVEGIFVNNTYGKWTAVKFKDNGQDIEQTFDVTYYKKDKKTVITDLTKYGADVKYVKFGITSNEFIDGATYTQTIEVTKEQGTVTYPVKTITAIMTKVMPDEFPKKFAFRPMQEINGVEGTGIFKSYLRPQFKTTPANMVDEYKIQSELVGSVWTDKNVESGWTDLNDVFYGLDANYQFIVKNTGEKDGKFTEDEKVEGVQNGSSYKYELNNVSADKKLMDDVTKHDITANYLYKDCSMKWDAKKKEYVTGHYPVTYDKNLQVIYSCWHHAESYSFAEGKAPQPQWTQEGKGAYVFLSDILAKSSYNDAFFGGNLKKIVADNNWLKIVSVKMYYGEQENPYFTPEYNADIKDLGYTYKKYDAENKEWKDEKATGPAIVFNQKDNQVDHNPTADHVEKLKITFKDSYGHEHDYTLDVTVKKAAAAK